MKKSLNEQQGAFPGGMIDGVWYDTACDYYNPPGTVSATCWCQEYYSGQPSYENLVMNTWEDLSVNVQNSMCDTYCAGGDEWTSWEAIQEMGDCCESYCLDNEACDWDLWSTFPEESQNNMCTNCEGGTQEGNPWCECCPNLCDNLNLTTQQMYGLESWEFCSKCESGSYSSVPIPGTQLREECICCEGYTPPEVETDPILGCTNSGATNYNQEATEDDGSCEYEPQNTDDNPDFNTEWCEYMDSFISGVINVSYTDENWGITEYCSWCNGQMDSEALPSGMDLEDLCPCCDDSPEQLSKLPPKDKIKKSIQERLQKLAGIK